MEWCFTEGTKLEKGQRNEKLGQKEGRTDVAEVKEWKKKGDRKKDLRHTARLVSQLSAFNFGGKVKWSGAEIHFCSAGTHSSVLWQMAFHFVKFCVSVSLRVGMQQPGQLQATAGPSCSWKLFVNSVSRFVPSQDLSPRLYPPFCLCGLWFLAFCARTEATWCLFAGILFLFQTWTFSHNILSQMSSSSEPAASWKKLTYCI